ncbi:MAG: multidrug ABC transporter ATP-binding protein [Alkaliphilus sp.]|nr:MAG: multidrug ABC transporter ATP-binding protein [Alkaliphilus sp.]
MPVNTVREDEVLKDSININIIKRLAKYLSKYTKEIVLTLLLMPIVIGVTLFNPYLLKIAIDSFIEDSNVRGLIILAVAAIFVNLVGVLASRVVTVTMSVVASKILVTIRQEMFHHIQKLSFSFFDSRPVGKVLTRIIGDVNSLNALFIDSVTVLIPDFITVIAIALVMISINYKLAVVALITLPFLIIFMFLIETTLRKRWQVFRKKQSNMNAYIHESYSGIRIVQSFTREKRTRGVFIETMNDMLNSFKSAIVIANSFWPLVQLAEGIGTIIVFWYGVTLLRANEISVGTLVAFISYLALFWFPIMKLSNFYNILVTNVAGAERIFEILDIDPEIVDNDKAIELPKINGTVEFKDVTFSYGNGVDVLKNVSFKVEPGKTIALVGETGAGKTTIVSLISRFYDIEKGKLLIDGHDIKDVTVESLRGQMAIMTQETFLFSGTIKENIRYGRLDATDEEVIEAAKVVNAHSFIMKLEKGYDTDVNERGARLSVGQRQLVALSRAVLADPRILILDEATSSIDTETEKLVQKGISNLLSDRTAFVIAHRLSTIKNADRIMVIGDGRIIEEGSHNELLKKRGEYYNLHMAQFKFLD